ncbi:MAG TPA: aspartate aminotransferase family protein [Halothiobacillaceae bacterium]|nr:aspartate aminotransferase family protein [Halothiobacillaceae bacterium]
MNETLLPTYKRQPVAFTHGKGAYLYDEQKRAYFDAVSGIAVTNLGHAHPAITKAICDQAAALVHTSNLYRIPWQETLGDKLTAASGMEKVFFANSGAEANEAAIKLARLHGHHKNIAEPKIIVMENSFHGRTNAALAATGNISVQRGFEPLFAGFLRVGFDDLDAVADLAAQRDDIVAVLVEPVQGEGGVKPATLGYLQGLRDLCDQNDWLLMLDEIQTGMGRTGQLFAFQHEPGLCPDVMTLAKGLGNGVPIGACLTAGKATALFGPGSHGSTFGGNPLSARVGCAVLDAIAAENLLENVQLLSGLIFDRLRSRLANQAGVLDIRGRGFLIGIELDRDATILVSRALAQGLLINVTQQRVVRILPPLMINQEQAEMLCDRLATLILKWLAEQ